LENEESKTERLKSEVANLEAERDKLVQAGEGTAYSSLQEKAAQSKEIAEKIYAEAMRDYGYRDIREGHQLE
jgi:hypothetical protein